MKRLICVLIIFALSTPVWAENYCDDKAAQKQWQEMSDKYPNDDAIQTLHALWIGLCAKVKMGDIDEQRAIRLFEQARVAAIDGKLDEEEVQHMKQGL